MKLLDLLYLSSKTKGYNQLNFELEEMLRAMFSYCSLGKYSKHYLKEDKLIIECTHLWIDSELKITIPNEKLKWKSDNLEVKQRVFFNILLQHYDLFNCKGLQYCFGEDYLPPEKVESLTLLNEFKK